MRDMGSHGNGYGDVDVRNAINWGDLDGPRCKSQGAGSPGGRSLPIRRRPSIRSRASSSERKRKRVPPCASTWIAGVDWIKLYPTGGIRSVRPVSRAMSCMYPLPVLQALVDETHRLGKKAACHAFGGDGLHFSITAGCDSVEHGYGLTRRSSTRW